VTFLKNEQATHPQMPSQGRAVSIRILSACPQVATSLFKPIDNRLYVQRVPAGRAHAFAGNWQLVFIFWQTFFVKRSLRNLHGVDWRAVDGK
jgi:hypothetical protein